MNEQHNSVIKALPAVPNLLSGREGSNRKNEPNLLNAEDDLTAITSWLNLYIESPHTLRSYHKEIERFYQWSLVECEKSISDLGVDDLMAYWRFLSNPQPAERWCGKPKLSRTHPDWRPFNGGLTDASRTVSFAVIGRCFSYLTDSGYLRGNPVRLMNKRNRPTTSRNAAVERYLPKKTWQFLWRYITEQQPQTENEIRNHERSRFLFALLYLQMPRASEVAKHAMNSFYEDRGGWWWRITGKGNVTRKIPVSSELLTALKRYRLHRSLPALPSPESDEPLVASLSGSSPICADMIYKIVKKNTREAALELMETDPSEANKLYQASTHWFRHTGLTHLADRGVDLRFIKATARHESLETTQRYLHVEEDEWQAVLNQPKLQEPNEQP